MNKLAVEFNKKSYCVSEMSKYIALAIICGILTTVSVGLTIAYSASSLEELRNKVTESEKYKNELIGYATQHNFSVLLYKDGSIAGDTITPTNYWHKLMPTDFKNEKIATLEFMVKQHMEECQLDFNSTNSKRIIPFYDGPNGSTNQRVVQLYNAFFKGDC